MRWVMFLLILIPFALSIGIAPAEKIYDAEPGKEETILYRIYNSEHRDFTAELNVNGTLAEYVFLDTESLEFSKNDSYKTFMATVKHPDDKINRRADILVSGSTPVSAVILIKGTEPIPTANVVASDTEIGSYWLHAILIFIIIGNIAYFVVGGAKVKSPADLLRKLKKTNRTTFERHVTAKKNDYADWLRQIGEPELAYKIYDIKNRQTMILAIEEHLKSPEPTKDPEELKNEIHELKKELDSFDFREFERNI